MKILSNKEFKRLKEIEARYTAKQDIDRTYNRVICVLDDLARNLENVYDKTPKLCKAGILDADFLPENVLVYVDDMLGGKVIKQEATKCIYIDKNGNIKTGLTKQKSDKGFSYKLIRE